ncbi:hypothetical protein BJ085DRAFT_36201 [Dimargaris cristalligena]|uniref:Uncharacterized protein n=1 Tax=Dimargaris cristalligena TaxID=215637 RepID=A0A4P9ZQD2_9FUNG|nr:hypothetical protein BJ085DRAFT_36201 [Dimargaris cristalligena]|eukprot:RKP34590.1 hypothetical protein BJ085DRAFT_36201 [Dimargaris cristalligena]
MKVTRVYAKAFFVATAFLLVDPRATAAPGPAEAQQSLPATKRSAISSPEASAWLTHRYRSFFFRFNHDWGTRSIVKPQPQKRDMYPKDSKYELAYPAQVQSAGAWMAVYPGRTKVGR